MVNTEQRLNLFLLKLQGVALLQALKRVGIIIKKPCGQP